MQKDRKKEHKKFIKYMRMRNKQLAEDDYIGLNRFRFDLVREDWYRYEDGSGGHMRFLVKISDKWTGNYVCFYVNNYSYAWHMFSYANDFLIRCSDGRRGHFPPLDGDYVAYDIHEVIPYPGYKNRDVNKNIEDGVIDKWDWM